MDITNRTKINYGVLTFFLIALTTLFRFFYITLLPLSADEAYLWVCSRHLALSFYDTPPFAPFMIYVSTKLFGNTEFAVRTFVAILMAFSAYISYLLTKEVTQGNKKAAFFSALMVMLIPGYAFAGLLSGVEAPLIFFYILSVYLLYQAIIKEKHLCWYLAGITFGLGFNSKYLIMFIPLSLFLYLVVSKEKRKCLKTPCPYTFLLIGLLVSMPVIIWNSQNEWASFLLNFFSRTRTSASISINFYNLIKHIGAQAGIISPLMLIFLLYGFVKIFIEGVFKNNKELFFLLSFSYPALLFFGLYSLFIEIPAPHWVGTGYLTIIAGLPYFIHKNKFNRPIKAFFSTSLVTAICITLLLHSIPLIKNMLLKIPFNTNAKNEFESFLSNFPSKVGKKLGDIKSSIPNNENYFLIGRGFALASYLEFYNPQQEQVYMIFQRTKVGHGYYFWQDINEKKGMNAIFVDEDRRCEEMLQTLFSKVELIEDYHIRNEKGEPLMTFFFYDCIDFKGMEKEKPPVLKQ
ncbi:glycosyltransferase family 39 protein [bacterium]|nr:glycosyltransferase family 39 protein [bacterium]